MTRNEIQARLDRAEAIAAEGERLIAAQLDSISALERDGYDTTYELALVLALIRGRDLQKWGRDCLRSHLAPGG